MFCYSFHQPIADVASINYWIFVLWNAQFFYCISEESIQSFRIFWLFDRISPFPTKIMFSLIIPVFVKKSVIVFRKFYYQLSFYGQYYQTISLFLFSPLFAYLL